MAHRRMIIGFALLLGLATVPAHASDAEIPLDLQTALFMKILGFDESLGQQDGDLVMGIVVDDATVGRESMLTWEFGRLTGHKVQQRTLTQVVVIDGSRPDGLEANILASGANVLFLPYGSKNETIREVAYQAGQMQLPTLAGSRQLVKLGAAVGVAVEDGRACIVLNLRSCKKQGMVLSDELIQMSMVIRR